MTFIETREKRAKETLKELWLMRMEARTIFKALASRIEPNPKREKDKIKNREYLAVNMKLLAYITGIDTLSEALKGYIFCKEEYKNRQLKRVVKAEEKFTKAYEELDNFLDLKLKEQEDERRKKTN